MKRSIKGKEKVKRRRVSLDDKVWVSATKTRNYLIKDPLLDVLCLKNSVVGGPGGGSGEGSSRGLGTSFESDCPRSMKSFESYIMKKGLEFEALFIDYLSKKFPYDFVNIEAQKNPYDDSYLQKTLSEMIAGTPFIYSGLLKDPETCTFGIPDLIVRSDWLSKLASVPPITRSASRVPAKDIDAPDYHYRVVDIKFSTLQLRADGIHILNTGCFPAYKGQLWIYNRALGKLQGYTPESAYILGRRWKYTSKGVTYYGSECDRVLGTVNFSGVDQEYIAKTDDAVKWFRDALAHHHEWSLNTFPLPRKELYPNMCNVHDAPYHTAKVELADRIGEITKLWMCSVPNREEAHRQGVMSLLDPKLSSKVLGIKGKKVGPIVDAILKVNSPSYTFPTLPSSFNKLRQKEWKPTEVEFFVDFEFFNNIFGEIKIPISSSSEMIFMIGVGWRSRVSNSSNLTFEYKSFTASSVSIEEEMRVCSEFRKFIIEKAGSSIPRLYHWSHAENTQWSRACKRLLLTFDNTVEWVDLLSLFKNEPITVKGAYDFGLKSVTKALATSRVIPDIWGNLSVTNGLDAMFQAYEALRSGDTRTIADIEIYNRQDCRALFELLNMIRK